MEPMTDGPDWLGTLDEAEQKLWEAFSYGRQVEYWHGETLRAEVIASLALGAVPGVPGRTAGVRIRGATVVGELDLRHGAVDVPLTMLHCTFTGAVRIEESVTKSIDLTGSHLLRICATGAHIRGSLDLKRAEITGGGDYVALLANAATVTRGLYIGDGFRSAGTVQLTGIQVGGHLDLFGMAADSGPLQLYYAKAGTVRDGRTVHGRHVDGGVDSWPEDVQLDGFTYEAFDPYLPADERIKLLRRQPGYAAQPYEFMAAYYRELGHDQAAREILIEKEQVRHTGSRRLSRITNVISSTTIGYGYLPRRAALIALAVQAAASVFYAFDPPTVIHPGDHVTFYPVLYAADLFVPIVHFGQTDAFVAYVLPYLGWALGLAIVAGASRTLSKGGGGIV